MVILKQRRQWHKIHALCSFDKGPDSITSTTSTAPPGFLLPGLTTAANAATSDFNRQTGGQFNPVGGFGGFANVGPGNPSGQVPQFPGQGQFNPPGSSGFTGIPFGGAPFGGSSGQGNNSSGLPAGLGGGGIPDQFTTPFGGTGTPTGTPTGAPPLIDQGQDLLSNTLGGNFLSPDTNPFLQQTFDRAADLTRGRLDTEFSGAGRNLGAAQPARSEELQTLASNIFGQNFQAERDRQVQGLGQSLDFDPTNLLINRLAGIIPGAGGSTQSQQPVFRTGLF